MNANLTPTSSMVRRGRMAVAVLAAAMALAAGCGSDDTATTNTAKPAGAKENTTTAQCFTWTYPTVSTTPAPCAVGAQGPGGGRIFYDAGSQQSWGRFLEVAPQNWNLAKDKLLDCPGSGAIGSTCGSSDPDKIPKKTSDFYEDRNGKSGWWACGKDSKYANDLMNASAGSSFKMPGSAAALPPGIGTGRDNTAAILAVADCTEANPNNIEGLWSAFQKAANYRGGGLSDWFIPSKDELDKLCKYTRRNGIGGFPAELFYLSSTTTTSDATYWTRIRFDKNADCTPDPTNLVQDGGVWSHAKNLVRPIRAF